MDERDKKGEKKISRKKNDSDNEEEPKKPTSKTSRNDKKPNSKPPKPSKVRQSSSESDSDKKSPKNKKEVKSELVGKEKEKFAKEKLKPKKAKVSSESNDEDTDKPCKPQKRPKMVLENVDDSDQEIKATEELSRPDPIDNSPKGTTKKQPEKKKKKEESEEEDHANKKPKPPAKKKQEESESDSDSEKKKKNKNKQTETKTTEKQEKPDKKTKDKQGNTKKNTSESSESEDLKATKNERDKTTKQGKKKVQKKGKLFNDDTDSDPEEEKDQPTAMRQSTTQDILTSTRTGLFPTDKSEYLSFRSMILIDENTKKNIMVSKQSFTFGRDEKSSYRVNHEKVSLNQCEIFSNNDLAFLFDKNSTNGTFLQLRPGNAYQIRKNMIVEMGRSLFVFKREKKQKKFLLQGSAGRMLGKNIREFVKGEENFKFLVMGKQNGKNKSEYLCIEDEGIEDEHGLILNIGRNFFIMPLESEKGIWVKIGGKNPLEIDSDCCILKDGDRIKFGEDQILRVHKSEFLTTSICPFCQNHVAYFDFSCKNTLYCKNCIKNPENNQCKKCKTDIVNRRRVFY